MSKPIDEEAVQTFLAKYGDRPVKWKHFMENIGALSDTITDKLYKPLVDRIAGLEKETAELKAAKPNFADSFKGIWQPDEYARGDIVSWDGGAWCCRCPTKAKPGTSADWTLFVKRGKDGKDLRA